MRAMADEQHHLTQIRSMCESARSPVNLLITKAEYISIISHRHQKTEGVSIREA